MTRRAGFSKHGPNKTPIELHVDTMPRSAVGLSCVCFFFRGGREREVSDPRTSGAKTMNANATAMPLLTR